MDTITEFMENSLKAEIEDDLGYSTYDYRNNTDNSRNDHSSKTLLEMWQSRSLATARRNLNLSF